LVEARKAVELDPMAPGPHWHQSNYHCRLGNFAEARVELQRLVELAGDTTSVTLVRTRSVPKNAEEFQRLGLDVSRTRWERELDPPGEVAFWYAALGARDSAFEWLEKSVADHSVNAFDLRYLPEWDGLRGDPRYAATLHRMGLEP
jgi:hypothetical protein